jgi:hypothetical protein
MNQTINLLIVRIINKINDHNIMSLIITIEIQIQSNFMK